MRKFWINNFAVFFLLVLVLVILVGTQQPALAQPGGGGNPCPFPPCNPDVPITGIEWLLVTGGLLGARRLFSRRSKPSS